MTTETASDNLKTASTTINATATTEPATSRESQLSTIDKSMKQPQTQSQHPSSSQSSIFRQHAADGGSNGNNDSSAFSAINIQRQPQHEHSLQQKQQDHSSPPPSYQFSTPSRKFSPPSSQQQQQIPSPTSRRFLGSQSFGAGPGGHHRHINMNNSNSVPPRGRPIIDSSTSRQTQLQQHQQQRYVISLFVGCSKFCPASLSLHAGTEQASVFLLLY